MSKKIKHEGFKAPIMAVVKVIGLYRTESSYFTGGFLMYVCFVLPFLPTIYLGAYEEAPALLIFPYLLGYLVLTFFLGRYITKVGMQWSKKEYDALSSDQVTFPFLFAIGCYALLHFVIFKIILAIIM